MATLTLWIVLAPLLAALVTGLAGSHLGRRLTHALTITGVTVSCALSFWLLLRVLAGARLDAPVYTWMVSGGIPFQIGFLVDPLSALLALVVTFVSLAVHVYSIGYMADDPGDIRFFAYISLFTFAMLLLVLANNFLQLFIGWEGVGLVSYLLIGFWFEKPTATAAALKAFLVNRIGDLGFILGIAMVLRYTGSLAYAAVFARVPDLAGATVALGFGWHVQVLTLMGLLLFVGAMGKSAQIPLHVWLPDSMEGPTPISALIHAATMVTAGVYLVARLSPLYIHAPEALSVILVIGSLTAFFMGILGVVATDIKRVIAYSTLSQLGYMMAGLGASAFAAGIFHLVTHAFFKALLFLAAGSVILAMHHEQDMRKMGGLRKYLPVTYATFLVGALALVAFPGFSGYFSKDALIDAVGRSPIAGASFAYALLLLSVFVTALYTFRMLFMVFHGTERMDAQTREHLHESPWVVTLPLVMLAVPALAVGWVLFHPLLGGAFFGSSLATPLGVNPLARFAHLSTWRFFLGAFDAPTFYLMLAGLGVAAYGYLWRPEWPARLVSGVRALYRLLIQGYGFDALYLRIGAAGSVLLGRGLWKWGDERVIDSMGVNGTAFRVRWLGSLVRRLQTGFLYQYAFTMVAALVVLVFWALVRY
ncbi:proton-translocating NADH-quinone oxidoreductase, chain L [mine drainage metagenome]|uniref:Proton-translocating NADH-quinone oxidoreductase, chain L n=2 Tax=mine drainage metagenome TaxID=410659 RepID=T1BJJ1_9ZZZZ